MKMLVKIASAAFCIYSTSLSCSAEVWSFKATTEHVGFSYNGKADYTNDATFTGETDKKHFLFSAQPADDALPEMPSTFCGWDGTALRWYQVLQGKSNIPKDTLTSNSYFQAFLENGPIPREAWTPIQCLALTLLSPTEVESLDRTGTNYIRLNVNFNIPEMFSSIEVLTNKESGALDEVVSHAPNWVWVKTGAKKAQVKLPPPLNKGFVNWRLKILKADANGLPLSFEFDKFFYNAHAGSSSGVQNTFLIGKVIGTIQYSEASEVSRSWVPPLPLNGGVIYDYRPFVDLESEENVIGIHGILHEVINSNWDLAFQSPAATIQAVTMINDEIPANAHRRHLIAIALFLVMLAAPVGLYFMKRY